MVTSFAFIGGESGEMGLIFDLAALVPGPRMASDFGIAVEHPHDGLGGDERERLSDERMRDRIIVLVEAKVGRFA